MLAYIGCAFMSTGLFYAAYRYKARNNVVGFWILLLLSIALPGLMGGLRGDSVGTDTMLYGKPIYYQAINSTFSSYIEINPSFAPLFQLISWGFANISFNIQEFLFLISFLTLIPVYYVCIKYLHEKGWLGIFIYLLVFYPMTFNLMRQGLAISLVLLSLYFAMNKKPVSYFVFLGLAMLFHTSAAIAIVLFPLSLPMRRQKTFLFLYALVGFMLIVLFMLSYSGFVDAFAGISRYVDQYGNSESTLRGTSLFVLIMFLSSILLCYILNPHGISDDRLALIVLVTAGALMYCFSFFSATLYRVALYFLIASVLLLPQFYEVPWRQNKTGHGIFGTSVYSRFSCTANQDSNFSASCIEKKVLTERKVLIGLWVLCFFLAYYGIFGLHEIVPYVVA